MKKIKILHIQETIGSGGVERRRLSLAKYLDKDIFVQKFVCTIAKGNIPDEIRAEGHEVISIGKLQSPFQWSQHKKIQDIIDDYQPDIIHGAVFEGVTMAAINGFVKRVPIIIIEETSDPQNRSWKGNLLIRFFAKLSNIVIGVSPAVTEEYLLRKIRLNPKKVQLVNNGVAVPQELSEIVINETRAYWEIAKDDFVIGSVGRMLDDGNKRFSDLIKSFAKFAEDKEKVKLLLIGDGLERVNYEKLVKELKIAKKVIFAGYQSDVTAFYTMMNVFALVSRNESFGLVVAEAMLNRLPVVATKVGGMKYIVDDQQTGFLVEPFQVDEIAEKFETLYLNRDLCKKMGDHGFEKAMSHYTEDTYVNNIKKLYLDASKNI